MHFMENCHAYIYIIAIFLIYHFFLKSKVENFAPFNSRYHRDKKLFLKQLSSNDVIDIHNNHRLPPKHFYEETIKTHHLRDGDECSYNQVHLSDISH